MKNIQHKNPTRINVIEQPPFLHGVNNYRNKLIERWSDNFVSTAPKSYKFGALLLLLSLLCLDVVSPIHFTAFSCDCQSYNRSVFLACSPTPEIKGNIDSSELWAEQQTRVF